MLGFGSYNVAGANGAADLVVTELAFALENHALLGAEQCLGTLADKTAANLLFEFPARGVLATGAPGLFLVKFQTPLVDQS